MKKLLLIITSALALALLAWTLCTEETRASFTAVFNTGSKSLLSKMEKQVDQGELALLHAERAFRTAEEKLVQLKALKLDAESGLRQAELRVADLEKQGKPDLAEKNRQQVEFYRQQKGIYDDSIARRTQKLEEVRTLRTRTREDVRLIRTKITYLRAAKNALDDTGEQETLEHVEQLVSEMQQNCNRLTAEVEVLNMRD